MLEELSEKLGFQLNEESILVDGEERVLTTIAKFTGHDLLLPREFFSILGVRNIMYYPQRGGSVQAPNCWIVTT